jgi:predicted nucleotidyltransferase
MRDEILAALRSIEAEAQVRVLLAVESGSRAWGFASPDSDYDVRFVYVHEPAWYLTVFESRDVIEKMLPGELDVSGWDLRKSLRLFSKCNLALNEWLGSPVVYSETSEFRSELRALIPMFFNPTRATHHYRSMAKQALSNLTSENQISIKKLLYAARALLACRWIRQYKSQPPTEFHVVVEHVASVDERTYFSDLIARKSDTPEKGEIVLEPDRGKAIRDELETYERNPVPPEASPNVSHEPLNATLRRWVGEVL